MSAPFATTTGDGDFYDDPAAAVDRLIEIYDANTSYLVDCYADACRDRAAGGEGQAPVTACYPELRFTVDVVEGVDAALSHGFVDRAGTYATAIARPRLFARYLREQIGDLLASHGGEIEVRVSDTPIPLRLTPTFDDAPPVEGLDAIDLAVIDRGFTPVDSAFVDDVIADGEADFLSLPIKPLSLFAAPRVDLALQRLEHYTGSSAEHIQRFVLFTNYQLHTDVFLEYAASLADSLDDGTVPPASAADFDGPAFIETAGPDAGTEVDEDSVAGGGTSQSPYTHLICPGDVSFPIGEVPGPAECRAHASSAQMPAYHLVREDGLGVTIIDIGVGPSNAKTITDCLAVLRPHCWMMVGHCAGLDGRMRIGDMILANGYDRSDGVLDDLVPLEKPIPPIAEVQMAVTAALRRVSGLDGDELRKRLRTGTVLSTSDRNWEWRAQSDIYRELQKSTAIGVEMESATIAANGYRFRVPYGALLSVSDMPLHDQPKLPKAARAFYQASKVEHLMTAVRACEAMSSNPAELHSRKLRRPVGEVAFR